jgi:hypothetical protein
MKTKKGSLQVAFFGFWDGWDYPDKMNLSEPMLSGICNAARNTGQFAIVQILFNHA